MTGIDRLFILQSFPEEIFFFADFVSLEKGLGIFQAVLFSKRNHRRKKRHPDEWIALCMILSNRISEQFLADDGGIHFRRNGDEGDFLA